MVFSLQRIAIHRSQDAIVVFPTILPDTILKLKTRPYNVGNRITGFGYCKRSSAQTHPNKVLI
jgi:hypothetical protein